MPLILGAGTAVPMNLSYALQLDRDVATDWVTGLSKRKPPEINLSTVTIMQGFLLNEDDSNAHRSGGAVGEECFGSNISGAEGARHSATFYATLWSMVSSWRSVQKHVNRRSAVLAS
eukprot:g11651.t1